MIIISESLLLLLFRLLAKFLCTYLFYAFYHIGSLDNWYVHGFFLYMSPWDTFQGSASEDASRMQYPIGVPVCPCEPNLIRLTTLRNNNVILFSKIIKYSHKNQSNSTKYPKISINSPLPIFDLENLFNEEANYKKGTLCRFLLSIKILRETKVKGSG